MTLKKIQNIEPIDGAEGTEIRQIFHPHNTLNGIRFSISYFSIEPGKKSLLHKMKSSEIYYILNGEGLLHLDDEPIKVYKDQAIYIPPNSKQFIENLGKNSLSFLCIVDPAWRKEDEEILE